MKHIKTLTTRDLKESMKKGGCGECQTSCQSACISLQSFFTVFSPCPAGYSGQSVHRHFRIQRSGRSGANRQREKLSLSKSKAGIP